jgi:DNA topoisomerase-1
MKFSEYLLLEQNLNSEEDIQKAVNDFRSLEDREKPAMARMILKAAERVGYTIRAKEILKYDTSHPEQQKQRTQAKPEDAEKKTAQPEQKQAVQKQPQVKASPEQKQAVEPAKTQQPQAVQPQANAMPKKEIDPLINNHSNPDVLKSSKLFEKYGKMSLDRWPTNDVNPDEVQEFPDNVGKGPILRWKNPKNGEWMRAYEPTFLEANAQYKWERIKNIKPEDIEAIDKGSLELLKSENENDKDAGAIIRMILKTGLRPGDKTLKTGTDNRGISSLKPESVILDGDKISLDFIGKSTKRNLSELEDKDVAEYLEYKIKKNNGKDFLFDISKDQLDTAFKKISIKKDMMIKDMRTWNGTETAKNVLADNDIPPLPVPDKPSDIKKAVENKLKIVFDVVSNKLNNTPSMAKASYVVPEVIENWMKDIGVKIVDVSAKKYDKISNITENHDPAI